MYKICLTMFFFLAVVNAPFAQKPLNSKDQMDMTPNHKTEFMMYMDVGAGQGQVEHWTKNSFAMNAMTMGYYMKNNWGAEIGMAFLPNGERFGVLAQMMNYHIAAKGILPLNRLVSVYGKLGVGATVGMGEKMPMPSSAGMSVSIGAGPYYGVGAHFNLSRSVAIFLEDSGVVVVPQNSLGSMNMIILGIELRI